MSRSLTIVFQTWKRLNELGIDPVWCTNHGPTTSLYYADPDGNKAELQIDNFDTPVEFLTWAETSDFSENPIGVDFDPADLYGRLKSGEAESSLKARAVIGPRTLSSIPTAVVGRFHKILAGFAGK